MGGNMSRRRPSLQKTPLASSSWQTNPLAFKQTNPLSGKPRPSSYLHLHHFPSPHHIHCPLINSHLITHFARTLRQSGRWGCNACVLVLRLWLPSICPNGVSNGNINHLRRRRESTNQVEAARTATQPGSLQDFIMLCPLLKTHQRPLLIKLKSLKC